MHTCQTVQKSTTMSQISPFSNGKPVNWKSETMGVDPSLHLNLILPIFLTLKCCLLITSAAYFQMNTSTLEANTMNTLIRLLPKEQSDLGSYCLQYRPKKYP